MYLCTVQIPAGAGRVRSSTAGQYLGPAAVKRPAVLLGSLACMEACLQVRGRRLVKDAQLEPVLPTIEGASTLDRGSTYGQVKQERRRPVGRLCVWRITNSMWCPNGLNRESNAVLLGNYGGEDGSRTRLDGFAGRCITALLPRRR
jgi:hypothetical protein